MTHDFDNPLILDLGDAALEIIFFLSRGYKILHRFPNDLTAVGKKTDFVGILCVLGAMSSEKNLF